jgi:hypothetical protein
MITLALALYLWFSLPTYKPSTVDLELFPGIQDIPASGLGVSTEPISPTPMVDEHLIVRI